MNPYQALGLNSSRCHPPADMGAEADASCDGSDEGHHSIGLPVEDASDRKRADATWSWTLLALKAQLTRCSSTARVGGAWGPFLFLASRATPNPAWQETAVIGFRMNVRECRFGNGGSVMENTRNVTSSS